MTALHNLPERQANLLMLALNAIGSATDSEARHRLNREIARETQSGCLSGLNLQSRLSVLDELEAASLQCCVEDGPASGCPGGIEAQGQRLRDAIRLLRVATVECYDQQHSQRSEELAGMLASVTRMLRHDIKTPLQAASLNLEILLIEHAEMQVDTSVLELVQSSIEQAIAMLAKYENLP